MSEDEKRATVDIEIELDKISKHERPEVLPTEKLSSHDPELIRRLGMSHNNPDHATTIPTSFDPRAILGQSREGDDAHTTSQLDGAQIQELHEAVLKMKRQDEGDTLDSSQEEGASVASLISQLSEDGVAPDWMQSGGEVTENARVAPRNLTPPLGMRKLESDDRATRPMKSDEIISKANEEESRARHTPSTPMAPAQGMEPTVPLSTFDLKKGIAASEELVPMDVPIKTLPASASLHTPRRRQAHALEQERGLSRREGSESGAGPWPMIAAGLGGALLMLIITLIVLAIALL